jgi:polygalacturonase
MDNFLSARRDLLKLSGLGLASAAAVTMPAWASAKSAAPAPVSGTPGVLDVHAFGATGDGKTLDTAAINKAIETASAAGGGTVVFPAGSYLCFSIHLKSHVELYLAQGAIIIAADSPKAGETTGYNGGTYDAAEPVTAWDPYQDYGHNHWHNSLIWGEDIHDVSITGPGLIYGRGLSFGSSHGTRGFLPDEELSITDKPYPTFTAEQAGVGNKAIAMKNCYNVLLRDFKILKGGHFGLLLTAVDNLTIDNLLIDTDRDGMDIDCCKNVRVSNCTVNSPYDDAICPKSSFGLGYARICENVTIANNYVTGSYEIGSILNGTWKKFDSALVRPRNGRIKCGTESNGGFRNITITGNVIEGSQGIALESVDGALMEDIAISNTTMRDIYGCPLFIRLGARLRGPKESTKVGTARRILIDNLTCYNSTAKISSILTGIPGYTIDDVKMSNIYIQHQGGATADAATITTPELIDGYPEPGRFGATPSHGFFLRHMRHLEMSHVEVQPMAPDVRPIFYLEDVDRADFIAVTGPAPAFTFNKVTDLRVLISRAAKDTILATADKLTL